MPSETHPCHLCTCCGTCACHHNAGAGGRCWACTHNFESAQTAEAELARIAPFLARPDGWFVQAGAGSMVHRVDCPVFKGERRHYERLLDQGCSHGHEWPYGLSLPQPIVAAQVRHGARCLTCAPEVTPPPPPVRRARRKRTGTGWPTVERRYG